MTPPPPARRAGPHHPYTRIALLLVLLLGAALRLHQIDQPLIDAFSWRQASTAMMAENFYHTSWNIFFPEVNWTGPGPNYQGREFQTVSYLAALLYTFFGEQEWIGRGIAVIFGVWGIAALFLLVRRVWDDERALASAAVLAVLPGAVFIDRSFLPDPAMVALSTTSAWLFVVYLQTERLRYLLLAAGIGAWAFLTKIPGLILGLPMLYAAFATYGPRGVFRRDRIARLGVFGLLTLAPVIGYYLWARHLALAYPPHHFAGAGNWVWDSGLRSWLDQHYFLPSLAQRFRTWIWTPFIIALVTIGLLYPPHRQSGKAPREPHGKRHTHSASWLFHWWMVAGVIYYLLGAKELVGNPWNFHILNPAAAALAGHALVSIARALLPEKRSAPSWPFARALIVVGFVAVIAVAGQRPLRWMYHPYAEGALHMGLALREVTARDALVITMAGDLGDPSGLYYARRRGWVFPPARPGRAWGFMPAEAEAIRLLDSLRAENARYVGIVLGGKHDIWRDHPGFAEHLDQHCVPIRQHPRYLICRITPAPVAFVTGE